MSRHNHYISIHENLATLLCGARLTDSAILFTQCQAATLGPGPDAYGLIPDAAIVVQDEIIHWIGAVGELPPTFAALPQHDLGGRLVTPALIDCHTHIIHGGNRAAEFEMRLNGATYEQIARAGGGIVSTVTATRDASEDALVLAALPFVDAAIAEGVAVIEVKSGYGLDRETELRMLRAARKLAALRPIRISTTFLGAHAIPSEFKGRADAYIDDICIPTLHAACAEGLVDAVDGFCEGIAFSCAQIERVFQAAQNLGLPVKLHAEQLSNLGGAALAARYGALSADHLEYLDEAGVNAMARAGTVAVILPGAFYTLRETQMPPIALLRQYGVPMAVATDLNPGSSPLSSLLLAMNMACTLFRMSPAEALAGVTVNAARALGMVDRGSLAVGQVADLAVWNCAHPAELAYRIGFNPLHQRIIGGVI
jgi:imidazolonepropionase